MTMMIVQIMAYGVITAQQITVMVVQTALAIRMDHLHVLLANTIVQGKVQVILFTLRAVLIVEKAIFVQQQRRVTIVQTVQQPKPHVQRVRTVRLGQVHVPRARAARRRLERERHLTPMRQQPALRRVRQLQT